MGMARGVIVGRREAANQPAGILIASALRGWLETSLRKVCGTRTSGRPMGRKTFQIMRVHHESGMFHAADSLQTGSCRRRQKG